MYDAFGKLSAEYSTQVPAQNPKTSYLTSDALGSVRVITDQGGEVVSRRDFMPFGVELTAGIGPRNTAQKYSFGDGVRQKFTTYKRDDESGLDYAESRYYSPKWGRFTSPDEFKGGPDELFDFEEDASDNPTFYADLTNPQSLNKYQYAYNNPYKLTDPTGHCPFCIPILVGAIVLILSNPQQLEEPQRQTNTEAAIDIATTILPVPGVGKVLGGVLKSGARAAVRTGGKAIVKAGERAVVKQGEKQIAKRSIKSIAPGSRPGKKFTKKGKDIVKAENASKNGGVNKCENCGVTTTAPKKTPAGGKRPKTETNVDHINSRKSGGSGTPENGQVLCLGCNLEKGPDE